MNSVNEKATSRQRQIQEVKAQYEKEEREHSLYRVQIGVLITTVLASLASSLLAWDSARIASAALISSENMAQAQNRAYLAIEPDTINFDTKKKRYSVKITITNNGPTPARQIQFRSSYFANSNRDIMHLNFSDLSYFSTNNISLAPNQTAFQIVIIDSPDVIDHFKTLKTQEQQYFYIFGEFRYVDIFGNNITQKFSMTTDLIAFTKETQVEWNYLNQHGETNVSIAPKGNGARNP